MRAFACAVMVLMGCSKDPAKPSKAKDEHAEPKPKAKPGLALAAADAAVTQGVTATALVVVKQDGSISVVPLAEELADPHDLDLTTVTPGDVVAIADLAQRVATVQHDVLVARDEAAPPVPPEEEQELPPPPEEEMDLDEGKMGDKDSDRAQGQYEMKPNNGDPQRADAVEAARRSGVLGKTVDPCEVDGSDAGFSDDGIYGALLGNEAGEANGGFGYGKSGFGPGGGGTGWGTIGIADEYGARAASHPAGLRGTSTLSAPACGIATPLVLIDPRAPASTLIEVLTALPRAQLAATTDGGAHARALAIVFAYEAGNQPPGDGAIELGFTVGPDGAKGAGYRGAKADDAMWSWTGPNTALADGYHQGQARPELLGATFVRVRVDDKLNAGALVEAIATLVGGNADGVALGEPIDFQVPGGGGMHGRGGPVPTVKLETPVVTGAMEPAVIRRYLKRSFPKIRYCYEKQLLAIADLTGTIAAKFEIGANGTVTSSTAKGLDAKVSSCMAGVIQSIEYPKPKDGKPVSVTVAFDCAPASP